MSRQIANRYTLQDIIGKGGNGIVYTAIDRVSNVTVAIKQLRPEQIDTSPSILERFRREGEALRELDHPNIVKMLGMVEDNGHQYLIEEYIAGGDLSKEIRPDLMTVERVIRIALGLADALTRAHHLNIIHRDLKPGNILIADDGTPKLTDFGVALIGNKKRMTEKGTPVGTIEYLSPEALTAEVDNRSDIWAFGVLLFEMLAQRRPFEGNTLSAIVGEILTSPLPDLELLRPDVPLPLIDLIYRMLEKNRNERIPSVRLIGAELEAILQGEILDTSNIPVASGVLVASQFAPDLVIDSATRHNLPTNPQAFIGREYEIDDITRLINNPEIRLITVQATGGMGKTRLALEIGYRVLPRFENRVFFIDLAPIRDSATIAATIAEAMHFKFVQGERSQHQQLLDYLNTKHALLILDNLEHLMDDVSLITQILEHTSEITILITSRQKLNHSIETVVTLQGMEFPEDSAYESALQYPAVQLFAQYARRIRPDFEIMPDDISHVSRICRLVEGLPLGIILAASWVGLLTVDEIATEIEESTDFLATDMTDLPERHRSIRAVFDYSWQLLDNVEKTIFMKMGVFRAGFTRDAGIEIVGANLRLMMALMNKSLLLRNPDTGRYSIHDSLRAYAKEKLDQSDLESTVRMAHMQYYSTLANREAKQLFGGAQLRAMEVLDAELDNIRSAWQYAIEQKASEQLSLLRPLWLYYDILGLWGEVIEMTERSLAALGYPQNEAAGDLYTMAGICAYRHGQMKKAQDYSQHALDIFMKLGHEGKQILPQINLLNIKAAVEGADAVIDDLHSLIEQARAYNLQWDVVTIYLNLGYAYIIIGDLQKAEDATRHAIEVGRDINDMLISGIAIHNLGDIKYRSEEPQVAKDLLTEALSVALMFDNILLIYVNLVFLSKVSIEMQDFVAATDYAYRAKDVANESGLQVQLHLSILASALCLRAELDEARPVLRDLLEFILDNPTAFNAEPELLEAVPIYLFELGRYEEANRWIATILAQDSSDTPVCNRLMRLQSDTDAQPYDDIITSIGMTLGIVNEPDTR